LKACSRKKPTRKETGTILGGRTRATEGFGKSVSNDVGVAGKPNPQKDRARRKTGGSRSLERIGGEISLPGDPWGRPSRPAKGKTQKPPPRQKGVPIAKGRLSRRKKKGIVSPTVFLFPLRVSPYKRGRKKRRGGGGEKNSAYSGTKRTRLSELRKKGRLSPARKKRRGGATSTPKKNKKPSRRRKVPGFFPGKKKRKGTDWFAGKGRESFPLGKKEELIALRGGGQRTPVFLGG